MSATVYVLLIQDRHTDTDVQVFASRSQAIDAAMSHSLKYNRGWDLVERTGRPYDEYWCEYGESCTVQVLKREVQ